MKSQNNDKINFMQIVPSPYFKVIWETPKTPINRKVLLYRR